MVYLEPELTARGIHIIAGETIGMASKGQDPAPEKTSLLPGVGVRTAHEERIKVIGGTPWH